MNLLITVFTLSSAHILAHVKFLIHVFSLQGGALAWDCMESRDWNWCISRLKNLPTNLKARGERRTRLESSKSPNRAMSHPCFCHWFLVWWSGKGKSDWCVSGCYVTLNKPEPKKLFVCPKSRFPQQDSWENLLYWHINIVRLDWGAAM